MNKVLGVPFLFYVIGNSDRNKNGFKTICANYDVKFAINTSSNFKIVLKWSRVGMESYLDAAVRYVKHKRKKNVYTLKSKITQVFVLHV